MASERMCEQGLRANADTPSAAGALRGTRSDSGWLTNVVPPNGLRAIDCAVGGAHGRAVGDTLHQLPSPIRAEGDDRLLTSADTRQHRAPAPARCRLAAALALAFGLAACGSDGADGAGADVGAGLRVADALAAGPVEGFERAVAPPQLVFPRDHGPHPGFRTEWWYVTGHVASAAGRRFGVQLVFFRQALAAVVPERAGALAARDMLFAHAALADLDGRRFHFDERISRAAGELAFVRGPADGQPFAVQCLDWSAAGSPGGDGFLPLRLLAPARDFAFDLELAPGKPVVLQGEAGLSRKSGEPGNASHYYSLTRLPLAGRITADGEVHDVRGEGWLDREWSTSALGPEQVGWDWFSLQLDGGVEVMWYQLRRRDGGRDPWSRGVVVDPDGAATRLEPAAIELLPDGEWAAADGGARYPARWRLRHRGEPAFDLAVAPLLADQELRVIVRYWEGAVGVDGTFAGKPATGRGYLEMTGYTTR
jgi:predicted secreted hydrolase